MNRSRVFATATILILASCTSTQNRQQLDAIEDQRTELGTEKDPLEDATDEQRECIEDRGDDSDIDVATLLTNAGASGVAQRATLINIIIDCIPQLGEMPSYVDNFTGTMNGALGAAVDIDTIEGGCLLTHIIDTSTDPGSALADGSSDDDLEVILTGFESCLDEESLAVLSGEEGTGPQVYGDDASLDALFDDCTSGDDRACDLLYLRAAVGSEYDVLASQCAGRGDAVQGCTAGLNLISFGEADPDAPALLKFETDCIGGDMTACDALFNFAPTGSEIEQFGFTCGGKIAVGAIPNCRTRFGSE